MSKQFSCTDCGVFNCSVNNSTYPKKCLTTDSNNQELLNEAMEQYTDNDEVSKIMLAAAQVEGQYYGQLTRVEEIVVFAKKIGAKKIGIASCMGLIHENKVFDKILKANGFETFGVLCKVGAKDKTEVGIAECDKIRPNQHESACNPIMQAKLCNREKTDLNVISGLCVGHDTLFIKYSDAPVTYLIVKDRVLAHNPIGALNTTQSYYKRVLEGITLKEDIK